MASNSIATFSLYSQTGFLSSRSVNNSIQHELRRLNHWPDKHLSVSVEAAKFCTSFKKTQSSLLSAEFFCSYTLHPPSPKFPSANCPPLSPQKSLFKFLSEKIVFFLIGSFIFMGFFNKRAALALPSGIPYGVSEEKMDAVKGKNEEELYEKILEKDPRNVEALKVTLNGKIRRGKSREAVKYVENLIDVEPDEVEWRLLLALCYETMGNLSKAKRVFREILDETPLMARALHGLAMVMHKNHEGPAIFEMLHKARELASRKKRLTEERNIRILIAQMHVVEGDLDASLKQFQDLVQEDLHDFRPYLFLGIIYTLQGKEEEAAVQFETYRALRPEEFPQRSFLDDVVLTAKGTPREYSQKESEAQFSNSK